MQPKICLITGATSGIGEATARLFAHHSFALVLCGRREERLAQLKKELSHTPVHTLCFDVGDKEAVGKSFRSLPDSFKDIDILINNAGNAHGMDPIQDGDPADWDTMIDSNLKGLLYVTKEVLPCFIKRKSGHIINVGSLAAKGAYPNGNVYAATKAAVDHLSRCMLFDLCSHAIKVTAIHPGLVETGFSLVRFKGDKEKAKKPYLNMEPLTGADIADVILYIAQTPPHVVLSDVVVVPVAQASATHVHRKS